MADGKVDGTSGSDLIHGSFVDAGGDSVDGADGVNDTIYGYSGDDTIYGGLSGNDVIYGGTGNDSLYGGSNGDDTLYGGAGNDYVSGDGNNDVVYGGQGDDTLTGDTGDDIIYVGSGDDEVFGGRNNDYIWILQGNNDYVEGNSGDDTLDFSALSGTTVSSLNFYGGSSTDGYVLYANGARLEFVGISHFAGLGDGVVDGTGASEVIDGTYVDFENDAVGDFDGSANDNIQAYGGDDTVIAGTGEDTIYGGTGNDSLYGEAGNDHIYGNSGDDRLYGGDGWDTLHSGQGNDTYYGGTGLDYIDFGAESSGVFVDMNSGSIGGSATGDVMGGGMDGVLGTAYDDTLVGYDAWAGGGDPYTNVFVGRGGNDWFDGRGGPDWMFGGSGDDTFSMGDGPGNDVVDGGETGSDRDVIDLSRLTGPVSVNYSALEAGTVTSGPDTINFTAIEVIEATDFADTVTGSAAGDTIRSGGGNDNLTMNGGDDSVSAGSGDDMVYGGTGNDSISGDGGADRIEGGAGADVLSGSSGNDWIEGDSGDDILIGGFNNDTLRGESGADVLYGGSGDDSLIGGSGDDSLYGGSGRDAIYGYEGNDELSGGAGLDSLFGGSGNDSFYSASGDDLIYGASGDDYVALTGMNAYQLFGGEDPGDTDFDVLDISALGAAGHVTSVTYNSPDQESGTILFSNGDTATFSGFEQVICFARGTRLMTGDGYLRIESLRPGDLLQTRDHGLQPVRWIGRRRAQSRTETAPVVIGEGTFGATRPVAVSPQHRILFSGWQAEVLFGEAEVLIPAKYLVDNRTIRRRPGGEVVYFHVCMDQHEILCADGVAAESFLPGDVGAAALTPVQLAGLVAAVPSLRDDLRSMTPARPILKAYEAQALIDLIADSAGRVRELI